MSVEELSTLEETWKRFRIVGGEGTTVHGSSQHGYAVDFECPSTISRGTGEGACCCPDDPSCFITDQTTCEACCPVCTYQGDDVPCETGLCGSEGACCYGDGYCTIDTPGSCADYGTYQGDGIVCDPNPCSGACCHDDGSCTILGPTSCEGAGGVYQGDGTICDPNPCPTCPAATLVCDSVSVTKSKCCAFTNPANGKCYFTETEHFTNTPSTTCCSPGDYCAYSPGGGCVTCSPYGNACPQRCITQTVVTPYTTSITSSSDHDCNSLDNVTDTEDVNVIYIVCCQCISDGGGFIECCTSCLDGSSGPNPPLPAPSIYWHVCTGVTHTSTGFTYSDEETDADLIAAAIAALASFDGVYDDSCGAIFDLTGTTVTIQRYKYKFTFGFPAPAGMTVDWDESGPDGVVHHTWTAIGGETETDVFEEDEPSTNGTTDTINIVVACL